MKEIRFLIIGTVLLAGLQADSVQAAKKGPLPVAEIKRVKPVDFQSEILPILRANCLSCHNRTKAKADLILETPQDIAEADSVVPGKPEESILFTSSTHAEDPAMPPLENKVSARALNPQELGLLKLWVQQGAKGEVVDNRKVEWQSLPPGLNPIFSTALTPDGQYAAAGRANQIFLYHIPSKALATRLTDPALAKLPMYKQGVAHRDMIHSLKFNDEGTLLASGGYRETKLWRRQPVKALRRIALSTDSPVLAISPDGKWLASGEGNNIRVIDPATGKAPRTLAGHKAPVNTVAFSPDNTRLLSGAADGTYHIWTIADGKYVAPKLEMEKLSRITAATWTTDGKLLVTAHEDNTIRSWDLATALTINTTDAKAGLKPLKEMKGHSQPILALVRVPNNATQILSGSRDGTVRHWDANTGAAVRSMTHGGPVFAVAISPDATKFASASENNTAKIWNAANGKQIAELRGQRDQKLALATQDREHAFAKSEVTYHTNNLKGKTDAQKKAVDRLKKADEAKKKAEAMPIAEKKKALDEAVTAKKTGEETYNKLKADYDNEVKVFTELDKVAKVAEAVTKTATAAAKAPAATAATKAKAATTKRAAADKAKKTLDTAQAALKKAEEKLKNAGDDNAKKSAQNEVAAAKAKAGATDTAFKNADQQGKAAEAISATAKATADKAKAAAEAATKVSTDKRKVATDSKAKRDKLNTDRVAAKKKLDETAKKVPTAEAEYKKLEDARQQAVNEFTLATKAKGKADGEVKVATEEKTAAEAHQKQEEANVNTAKETVTKGESPVRAIAFSPDSSTVATGGDDNLIHTWAAANGQPLGTFNGHTGPIKTLAYTPGGQLITGSTDKTVQVWNLAVTWKLERSLGSGDLKSPITDRVYSIDFSPDGKHIAIGSGEPSRGGEIMIWNVADGKLLKNFMGLHGDTVFGLEYSPDGRHIASASGDKFVKVTAAKDGKIVHAFEGHTHHALGVSWLPHGRQLVSVGADNSVRHWNFELGERIRQRTNFGKEVTSIHYVGYTDQAIVTAGDKSVRLIKSDLNDARSFSGGTDFMYTSDATPDGKIVIAGGQDSTLRVWNMTDGKTVATFESPQPATEKK